MTEKEALLWVLGILGSLCAAAITIDKVLEIIHKYIKRHRSRTTRRTSVWMSWTSASAPWSRASSNTHKPLPAICAASTKSTR